MKFFTLVEMMIVLFILAIIATCVIPATSQIFDRATENVNQTQMGRIFQAFSLFATDVQLAEDESKLTDIVEYGLWPLSQAKHPVLSLVSVVEYPQYHFESAMGRRLDGYLVTQQTALIKSPSTVPTVGAFPQLYGCEFLKSGGIRVPVYLDPYQQPYRVVLPVKSQKTQLDLLKSMGLHSCGENGLFELTPADFDENGFLLQNKFEKKDDLFIPLFPKRGAK